jgi:preprotein translocase subunit SecD
MGELAQVADKYGGRFSSIRDSNISSLITAGILYGMGTGSIKGFAVTLAIGVLVSMFTAITVTKTILKLFIK